MARIWDDLMKVLVGANPQHFVSLLLFGAQFESNLDKELKVRTIEADLLYNVIWNKENVVLHVEFQRRHDTNMGKRLWEYNIVTSYLTKRPVCSFALYVRKDVNIVEPPYIQILPDGEIVHLFYFRNIKLWELQSSVLKQPGLEGMLPLLPLTRDGARYEEVEAMLSGLKAAGKEDLYPLGYSFAALAFESEIDKEWLRRRFAMLHDILEESWAYQEIMGKGREEGHKEGRQQGYQQAAIDVVVARFPDLETLARTNITAIDNLERLQHLVIDLSISSTREQMERVLFSLGE